MTVYSFLKSNVSYCLQCLILCNCPLCTLFCQLCIHSDNCVKFWFNLISEPQQTNESLTENNLDNQKCLCPCILSPPQSNISISCGLLNYIIVDINTFGPGVGQESKTCQSHRTWRQFWKGLRPAMELLSRCSSHTTQNVLPLFLKNNLHHIHKHPHNQQKHPHYLKKMKLNIFTNIPLPSQTSTFSLQTSSSTSQASLSFHFFSLRHLSGLSGGVPSWPESWILFSLTPSTHLLIERFDDLLTISHSNLHPTSNAPRMSLQCAACTVAWVCLPWSG